MGLDMYAYSVKDKVGMPDVDYEFKDDDERVEIMYWRKHHDLHGWMKRLYEAKEGEDPSFNCNSVRLTSVDLDQLEKDIRENKLPHTEGFFFGNNPPNEDTMNTDLEFIKLARSEIKDGNAVYYYSWW